MDVLVIGSGGREHAIAWKISQSKLANIIFVAPGNAGTEREEKIKNIDIEANDIDSLLLFAKEKKIDLTIVGPENPLVSGIVDRFEEEGLLCLGPCSKGARLEGSKNFMKEVLVSANIPTANYAEFDKAETALDYLDHQKIPVVIKADGLAAGKGVVVAFSKNEAKKAITSFMLDKKLGSAGSKIIIEEFLTGDEASFIVLTDGDNIIPLATSQDHKQRDDNDKGPNTGGMGAYSPTKLINEEMNEEILESIIKPTLEELKKRGITYKGFLYAGLMINKNKIKVLEYNCRFGDPETQPILLRMKSDFLEMCFKACEKKLNDFAVEWEKKVSVGVVLASGGYPEYYKKGYEIKGIPEDTDDLKVFHCGTKSKDGKILTNGGRVLCITSKAEELDKAIDLAYTAVGKINWQGSFYRSDIGQRKIN